MSDSPDDPDRVAIEQLEQFGLTAYAARTFVALSSLGTGTARDVSEVAAVPRTRVYDAIDELQERGLVDVVQSSPKQFWATSAETASRTFEHELRRRVEVLRTALRELEPVERRAEQRSVWTVSGEAAVSTLLLELFEAAADEIVYMTVEELLSEELIAGLHEATERGVSVKLAGVSTGVQTQVQERIPDATTFESLWAWSDMPVGRLTMVDGEKTLASVQVTDEGADYSAPRAETAIWGEGETNSLVVVLKAMFAWRLDSADSE